MSNTHFSPSSDIDDAQEVFVPIVVVSAPRTPAFMEQSFSQPTGLLQPHTKPLTPLFKGMHNGAGDLETSARAREHLERRLKDMDVKMSALPSTSTPSAPIFRRGHRRSKTTISVSPASETAPRPAFLDPLQIPAPLSTRPSHPVISLMA